MKKSTTSTQSRKFRSSGTKPSLKSIGKVLNKLQTTHAQIGKFGQKVGNLEKKMDKVFTSMNSLPGKTRLVRGRYPQQHQQSAQHAHHTRAHRIKEAKQMAQEELKGEELFRMSMMAPGLIQSRYYSGGALTNCKTTIVHGSTDIDYGKGAPYYLIGFSCAESFLDGDSGLTYTYCLSDSAVLTVPLPIGDGYFANKSKVNMYGGDLDGVSTVGSEGGIYSMLLKISVLAPSATISGVAYVGHIPLVDNHMFYNPGQLRAAAYEKIDLKSGRPIYLHNHLINTTLLTSKPSAEARKLEYFTYVLIEKPALALTTANTTTPADLKIGVNIEYSGNAVFWPSVTNSFYKQMQPEVPVEMTIPEGKQLNLKEGENLTFLQKAGHLVWDAIHSAEHPFQTLSKIWAKVIPFVSQGVRAITHTAPALVMAEENTGPKPNIDLGTMSHRIDRFVGWNKDKVLPEPFTEVFHEIIEKLISLQSSLKGFDLELYQRTFYYPETKVTAIYETLLPMLPPEFTWADLSMQSEIGTQIKDIADSVGLKIVLSWNFRELVLDLRKLQQQLRINHF